MEWIVLVIVGIILWAAISWEAAKKKRVREARQEYDRSLAELKQAPSNPDLKQRTLALGRAYSNLTRQQNGVTIYDELALSNDINAACAGATGHVQTSQQLPIETRLARLAELWQQGLLAEEEFQSQRIRILQEL